jgi:VWFA-related protein
LRPRCPLAPDPENGRHAPEPRRSLARARLAPPQMVNAAMRTTITLVSLAFVATLTAQESAPLFRTRTDLVRLDVRITDRLGRPIDDLERGEIEIVEEGRARPVVMFQHVRHQAPGQAPAAAGPADGELTTNASATPARLYMLVFDQLHMDPRREQSVRQAAERFLAHEVKPGDAVAVFGLPGPGPALGFTSDLWKARQALRSVHGRGDARAEASTTRAVAFAPSAPGAPAGDDNPRGWPGSIRTTDGPLADSAPGIGQADTQSHVFLTGLSEILRAYRYVEGRKALVLFSEGFGADRLRGDVEDVAAAAAQTTAVIYPVALDAPSRGAEFDRPDRARPADLALRFESLATLAGETCGRLLSGVSQFDASAGAISAEAYDYYMVGFEPAAQSKPLGYRRVSVRVTRPGASVMARTGYAAPATSNPSLRRRAIDMALAAPYPVSAIPLEYTTYERRGAGIAPSVILSLTAHLPAGTDPNQAADVVFVVRNSAGVNVASGTGRMSLPPASASASRPGELVAVPYRVQFDLAPGEYAMRVLVRDPAGLVGSGDRQLSVRPLSGPGLATSDLILARTDGKSFEPPSRAELRADEGLLAYLEVYGDEAQLASVATRVELLPLGGTGRGAVAGPLTSETTRDKRVLRARLAVDGFQPGKYEARVHITDARGLVSIVRRAFEVVAR